MKKMKKMMTKNTKKINRILEVVCPKCKGVFGLDTDFVEWTGDAHFHYNCPYCAYSGGLK